MPFDDHTSAAEIRAEFGLSRKAFKRGLGRLYRQRRVELLPKGVRALTPVPSKKNKEETRWRKPASQS
jgi:predicted RNA-binding protein (virulence factor B family)